MGSPILNPAPIRQPMFDAQGNLSRAWLIFFAQLFAAGGATVQNTESITDMTEQISFSEDSSPQNVSALTEHVLLETLPPSRRDFAPDIEAALRLLIGDAPRVPTSDLDELRNAASGDAANNGSPNLGLQQQLDEMRALLVASEPPLPLANGASGVITIPKLATANGSITVTNGIITGFVQPT